VFAVRLEVNETSLVRRLRRGGCQDCEVGLGAMGSGMVKLLVERKGVRVVGAVTRNPAVMYALVE